jgi:hypothetical protein
MAILAYSLDSIGCDVLCVVGGVVGDKAVARTRR